MADAISLLRQFTIENKEYAIENDRFVFNDLAYPKDIKTNYLAYGFVLAARCQLGDRLTLSLDSSTGKDNTPKDYYTLESIIFLLKNVDLQHANYVKKAAVGTESSTNIARCPMDRFRRTASRLSAVRIVKNFWPTSRVKRVPPSESTEMLHWKSPCNDRCKVRWRDRVSREQHRLHSLCLVNKRPAEDPRLDAAKIARVEDDDMQKLKDRREKKFDEKSKEINADQIRPLSGELSTEAILKLRAKFRATARDKIVDFKNEDTPELSTEPVPITADTFEIMKRERTWRNRISVLQSTNKVRFSSDASFRMLLRRSRFRTSRRTSFRS